MRKYNTKKGLTRRCAVATKYFLWLCAQTELYHSHLGKFDDGHTVHIGAQRTILPIILLIYVYFYKHVNDININYTLHFFRFIAHLLLLFVLCIIERRTNVIMIIGKAICESLINLLDSLLVYRYARIHMRNYVTIEHKSNNNFSRRCDDTVWKGTQIYFIQIPLLLRDTILFRLVQVQPTRVNANLFCWKEISNEYLMQNLCICRLEFWFGSKILCWIITIISVSAAFIIYLNGNHWKYTKTRRL